MTDTAATRGLLASIPRFPLIAAPTPLDLVRCEIPGFDGRLFVKRDDSTGFALGGNKGRKLEFTVADALAKGATALVTASGIQSNHVRQTAAAAAKAGLACHAVLTPALGCYPDAHIRSGNVLLDLIFGATLHLAAADADVEPTLARVVADLTAAGERPYLVPLGASDGIGSLGYVACAWELRDQCAQAGAEPAAIFVATGSGGTHGGLLAGARLDGWEIPIIGISVSEPAAAKRDRVRTAIALVAGVLGVPVPCDEVSIVVHDGYTGAGYAHQTVEANHWIRTLARSEGILLDPVYTGKAFAGMADILNQERIGKDVVFLHTGGAPAIFADPASIVSIEIDAPALTDLLSPMIGS